MSITVTTDVFCDKCLAWTHGKVAPCVDARKARENAHERGWVTKRTDHGLIDLCPDCAAQFEKEMEVE